MSRLALAHPTPFSFLELYRDQAGVHGALVVYGYDAAHELGSERGDLLQDATAALAEVARLEAVLGARLRLELDGHRTTLRWQQAQLLPDSQSLRLPFVVERHDFARLQLTVRLFPYDPSHQTFVSIYEHARLSEQAVLDIDHPHLEYYAGTLEGRWQVVRTFVATGIGHILTGPDHLLFLTGLLLLGGSLRRLAAIVTAFTAGHSVTLSLAALDLVHLTPRLIEPAIALSIVVVGVDNLLVRAQPSGSARDLRPALAGAFGLIHGFGFASVLQDIGLPRAALAWSLAAFNVGVEIGQLAIVVLVAGALSWLRRRHAAVAAHCVLAGSLAVVAAGAWWFVQRLWFAPA